MIKDKSVFHLIPDRVTDPTHTFKCSSIAVFAFRIIHSLHLLTYFHSVYNLYSK